jgi:predicted dehydrogenase
MKKNIDRRKFLKTASAVGAGAFVAPQFSIGQAGPSANSKVNIAMIGGGGIAHMAYGSLKNENIVAVCDVDSNSNTREGAQSFTDFRVMLDKMGKEIDGVCINTPDHTHFVATMDAMQRGLHVCTQKPLTHNIWQARVLREAAKKYKVITNMANQGHTYDGIRQMRELYEADILGQVKEIHCGIGGPTWDNRYFTKPAEMPMPKQEVPANLNWDLWVGPEKETPYSASYHTRKWRSFWQFGTGMLGDWFCHIGDGPVWILDLYDPTVIECVERKENAPGIITDSGLVRWEFPKRGDKDACTMYWHDGMTSNGGTKMEAPEGWSYGEEPFQKGSYWYGTKQDAYLDERSNHPRLAKRDAMVAYKMNKPAEVYPRVKANGPHDEWAQAIKNDTQPGANFEFASRLTETCLLGVLAERFGGRIEWNAKKMEITNRKELNAFVREPVRKGWEYGLHIKV